MDIILLEDRVLIDPVKPQEKQGELYRPTTEEDKLANQGIVLEVGPGTPEKPMSVQKNDTVIFDKYGPSKVTIEGKSYLIAREDMILAIIK